MTEKKERVKCLALFLVATLLFFIVSSVQGFLSLDDVWNMHMIEKVANGFWPYQEISMIVTPLFHYIGALFFRVLGENFRVFFLYGALTTATIFMVGYAILRKITQHKGLIYMRNSTLNVGTSRRSVSKL